MMGHEPLSEIDGMSWEYSITEHPRIGSEKLIEKSKDTDLG